MTVILLSITVWVHHEDPKNTYISLSISLAAGLILKLVYRIIASVIFPNLLNSEVAPPSFEQANLNLLFNFECTAEEKFSFGRKFTAT